MQYAHHIGACRDSLLSCGFNFVAVVAFIFFTVHQGSCQHSITVLVIREVPFSLLCWSSGGFPIWSFQITSFISLLVQPVVGYREGRAVPTQWESNDSLVWLLQRALSTHGFTAHGLITQLYIGTWTHYTLTCYTRGPIPANKWCLMTTWL